MKSGTSITIVIVAGFILIGYLFYAAPATAPGQLPYILAGIGSLILVFAKQGETDARVDSATEVSKHNANKLEQVAQQVDANTEVTENAHRTIGEVQLQATKTNELMNGQSHDLTAAAKEVAELKALVARLTGEAEGREAGRQIAVELLAANAQVLGPAPDGTIVVTAPALIAVKAPERDAPEAGERGDESV